MPELSEEERRQLTEKLDAQDDAIINMMLALHSKAIKFSVLWKALNTVFLNSLEIRNILQLWEEDVDTMDPSWPSR